MDSKNSKSTKKCRECHEEIPKRARKCKHCGSDLRSWFGRHPIMSFLIILFLLPFILSDIINNNTNDTNNLTSSTNQNIENISTDQEHVEEFNIEVSSQIVKDIGGKYRYFFDIRNKDTKDFVGDVSIKIITQEGLTVGSDDFSAKSPISPSLGSSVYIDANTGPVSVHGANGTANYKYTVKVNGIAVKNGEGSITNQFEDLSGF